jgi:hypothetical protein
MKKTGKSDHSGISKIERCMLDRQLDNTQNGMLVNSANTINSSTYGDLVFLLYEERFKFPELSS